MVLFNSSCVQQHLGRVLPKPSRRAPASTVNDMSRSAPCIAITIGAIDMKAGAAIATTAPVTK
jgi:hypothetical protein